MQGEFGFIAKIKDMFDNINTGKIEGIGDDCAIIPLGINPETSLVVTTDMLVEDVHFLRRAIDPRMLGRKALMVNLSDIAAMGATPIASLLSISLPGECQGVWAEDFVKGYRDLSEEFNVALIGGDTTSSLNGVTINVVAIGQTENKNIKHRRDAIAGDNILVTGKLGVSAAGLKDILDGKSSSFAAQIHNNPSPQVREGEWLGKQQQVHAMMDISDGVASDLMHILRASKVKANIYLERIPTDHTIECAVAGGEDYKLLLTASNDETDTLKAEFEKVFGMPLYVIGEIAEGASEIIWFENGGKVNKQWHGYTHF